MRRRFWLIVVVVFITTLAGGVPPAMAASPVGTTISVHGQSTVIRSESDTTAPLRMRDPVYVRDRVGTAEKSIVRLLLGGKALVTVRESSVVTITDSPEHSAITLREGKLALGLAKDKLRQGDVVEVRTPNAVAGIRGSFLVAETVTVNGVVHTVFSALHVSTPIVVTFAGSSTPTSLGINQTLTVKGLGGAAVISPVRDLTPNEIRATAAVSSAPSLTGRDVQTEPGLLDSLLLPWVRPTVQFAVEVPRSFTVSEPLRNSAPPVDPAILPPPGAGPPPPSVPPDVPPVVPPPPVALPPPPPPPVVIPPLPPALRGLDRANQVAGENGAPGRGNAAGRGNR